MSFALCSVKNKKGFILVLIGHVLYVVSDLLILKRSQDSRDGKTEKWLTHLQDGKKNMVGSFPLPTLTVAYLHTNYEELSVLNRI